MTLNQIIDRIKKISLAHKQLNNFYFGFTTDFLTDKTTVYPSAFLNDNGGNIDVAGKQVTYNFKIYLLDLVNIVAETSSNELEVQSDMMSVGLDLLAEFEHSSYTDWKLGFGNTFLLVQEAFDDMIAGVQIDFSITVMYTRDTCAVPTLTLPLTT